MKTSLPVPHFEEDELSFSFKQPKRRVEVRVPRTPKFCNSFSRGLNSSTAKAISFKMEKSLTPLSALYNKNRSESYYEQCFEPVTKIGEGSFGEVFKVRSKVDGCFYAVKKSKEYYRSMKYRQERLEEVRRHEQFSDHENCVKLYSAWEQDERLYMQMELCKCSLEDYVRQQRTISQEMVWTVLVDLLLALKSLHDRNLIHLDIKLDNILITDNGICKLADFGLVYDLNNIGDQNATEGDSRYIAPELMQGNYTKAADIFSLGIATLELACNIELPPNGPMWQRLRNGDELPVELITNLSPKLRVIIQQMMHPQYHCRPTVDDLLQNVHIKQIQRSRHRWRFVRDTVLFFKRKLCNFGQLVTKVTLWLVSCIRLQHVKSSGDKSRKCFSAARSRLQGNGYPSTESSPRSCLLQDFDGQPYDEDPPSFRSFADSSSQLASMDCSRVGDDSLQVTPTFNNSVPTHTPTCRIVNSTPLAWQSNHLRQGRDRQHLFDTMPRRIPFEDDVDLSLSLESSNGQGEPSLRSPVVHHYSSNHICFLPKKKLFFQTDDADSLDGDRGATPGVACTGGDGS